MTCWPLPRPAIALLSLVPLVGAVEAQETVFQNGFETQTCEEVENNSGLFLTGLPSAWSQVYGQAFPNPLGNTRRISIQSGFQISLEFTASASVMAGTLDTTEASGFAAGPVALSISRCRRDFRLSELVNSQRNCMTTSTNAAQVTLVWAVNAPPSSQYCPLVAGQSYWLNIAHINPLAPTTTNTCEAGVCHLLLRALPLGRRLLWF